MRASFLESMGAFGIGCEIAMPESAEDADCIPDAEADPGICARTNDVASPMRSAEPAKMLDLDLMFMEFSFVFKRVFLTVNQEGENEQEKGPGLE